MIISLILSTAILGFFVFLTASANSSIGTLLKNSIAADNTENIKNFRIELNLIMEKVKRMNERTALKREIDPRLKKRALKLQKKIKALEKRNAAVKKGVSVLDIPAVAGYSLISLLGLDNDSEFVAATFRKCCQFKETDDAQRHTYYVIANLFGNLILGAGLSFLAISVGLGTGMGARAFVFAAVILAIIALVGYIPYSDVDYKLKQRNDSIEHDFPRVVSKLTLLTISGMEVNSAWNITASSDTTTLYNEMMRVKIDLSNNVPTAEAYTKFIKRCNNTYATKLATAIMQNATMGNAEIARVLSGLNRESWSEYKHSARRKGEMISSKLLIPTILMFVGIIIIIIVPVMGGFNI